jgi:hypothetical protein
LALWREISDSTAGVDVILGVSALDSSAIARAWTNIRRVRRLLLHTLVG